MRKSLAIATFVVAGAGALGAGALSLKGSDTLGNVTNEMINGAPAFSQAICQAPYTAAQSLTYLGGGSGGGESAMAAAQQAIAPMSKMLTNTSCTVSAGGGSPTTASGLVVALDGVAITSSLNNAASTSCNGPAGATACTVATGANPAVGLASDGANAPGGVNVPAAQRVSFGGPSVPYTFASWQDVVKILYFGDIDPNFHPTDPEKGINCNSSVRQALANNYSEILETPTCAAGTCTKIQHLFRRDDSSGTSDIFSAVLGFSANYNKAATNSKLGGYFLGADNFCNDMPNQTGKFAFTWYGQNPPQGGTSYGTSSTWTASVPNDDQDYDPIRRPCPGRGTALTGNNPTEQVCEGATFDAANTQITGTGVTATFACGATGSGVCPVGPSGSAETCYSGQCWDTGSLGLLLPMIDATDLKAPAGNPFSENVQYNLIGGTADLCAGSTVPIIPPNVLKANALGLNSGLCPNGDISLQSGHVCYVPADLNGNPNCLNFKKFPAAAPFCGSGMGSLDATTCTSFGPPPGTVDSRVYNLWAYASTPTTTPPWSVAVDNQTRPLTGAFFRIHTTQDLLSPNNVPGTGATGTVPICTFEDNTDQIGCLVQASPCSFGYAGRESASQLGPAVSGGVASLGENATAMKILGIPPAAGCVQSFTYKYSRKLYLNTIAGFGNASAAELALAQCENTSSLINQAVNAEGFIPIPSNVNNGNPYCEDFNESQICGASAFPTNTDGCGLDNAVGIAGNGTGGTFETTCGNGIVEPYEECDFGVAGTSTQVSGTPGNGSLPTSNCSTLCRFNQ